MENTLYIALSRQMVMQRHMEVIANNIANMSTPGYKDEQMMFTEYLGRMNTGETVSYVQDFGVARDFREGAFERTGNPLDLAIHGTGWFVVDTPEGRRYTRNGRFTLDDKGQLVTSTGFPVLDRNGQPIRFGANDTQIEVASDGTISTSNGPKGRVDIVSFDDQKTLRPEGSTLYSSDAPPNPALKAQIAQGMIEDSNVQPIIEITNMMSALRSYEAAQQLVEGEDGLMRRAIDTLTQQQAS